MRKIPNMQDTGPDIVWIKGENRTVWRNVYQDGEKFWCIWYNQIIELRRVSMGFVTVDEF